MGLRLPGQGGPPRAGRWWLSCPWHKAGPKVGSAPCNPPPMGWQALSAGPVGIASLVCPAGHGDEAGGRKALKGMKKQGAGLRPPVSRFWAVLLALVLESVRVGAVPVSISLSEGNGDLILTKGAEITFSAKNNEKNKKLAYNPTFAVSRNCNGRPRPPVFSCPPTLSGPRPHPHAPQGIQARQSPRGQLPRACASIGGGLQRADTPLPPPYARGTTTAHLPFRGGPPMGRQLATPLSQPQKNRLHDVVIWCKIGAPRQI